jgi:uncharacterized protein involved in cysteine biosynthesis
VLAPLSRALDQLADPRILRVLLGSVLLSAACFALLCAASVYGVHQILAGPGWLAWLAGLLGGFAALLAGLWLFLPVAMMIASLFSEQVCRAVEGRWYPALPPPQGADFLARTWDSVVLALLVLAMSSLSLILALVIPGIGLVLGWAITAWALGRGLFVAVAMRRMGRPAAYELYLRHRPAVLAQGAALALAGYVPLANLLVPVLGPACMVHVLMQTTAPRGR